MNGFDNIMSQAFADLQRTEACAGHIWTEPRQVDYRQGKQQLVSYDTNCTLCGRRASRPTRERLIAEVIDA